MKIIDIIKITNGYFLNMPSELKINNIVTDSRKVQKGDCFIAINTGSNYIEDAINNGCVLVITETNYHYKGNTGIVRVRNSIDSLSKLATYIRNKYIKIPLIGITGSCGKTTLKELLYNILSTKYKVLKTNNNNNNIIGISNTLLTLNNTYDIILCEMGSNNKGEIKTLCDITNPDIGIVTNIYSSHIGNFKTKEEIYKEKTNLLDISTKKIVNYNDKYLKKYKSDYVDQIKTKNIKYVNDSLTFDCIYDKTYKINFSIPNKKVVDLILLAINTSLYFKIDMDVIVDTINNYKTLNGRMNIIKNNYTIIDDSYNGSFESINFDYIRNIKNLIIILGSIKELGDYSKYYHKKINRKLKHINCIKLLVGEDTKYIDGIHFLNNDDILNYLENIDLKGKTIYIKGSHANNLSYIVEKLR